ncbi:hypothetical protein ACO0R3_002959 [Hanseniaspora guilliermondii]
MVSAAAKKRQQRKKNLRKNQNIQASKSSTDLNQFLQKDNHSDKEDGLKELGDQELEDLLNDDLNIDTTTNSHSKQKSGSNYTFFNDADTKADQDDLNSNIFDEDLDLLLSDDDLELHPSNKIEEPDQQNISLNQSNVTEGKSQVVSDADVIDDNNLDKFAEDKETNEPSEHDEIVPIQKDHDEQQQLDEVPLKTTHEAFTTDDIVQKEEHSEVVNKDHLNEELFDEKESINHAQIIDTPENATENDLIDSNNLDHDNETPEDNIGDIEPTNHDFNVLNDQEDLSTSNEEPTNVIADANMNENDTQHDVSFESEPLTTNDINTFENGVEDVEQIPDNAVVTAEYEADDNDMPNFDQEPKSEVVAEVNDSNNKTTNDNQDMEINAQNDVLPSKEDHDVPEVTNELPAEQSQILVDDQMSDEDFFNNISTSKVEDEAKLTDDQNQKENDVLFFDQLSSQQVETTNHNENKEEQAHSCITASKTSDDVEFYNNLNESENVSNETHKLHDDSLLDDDNDSLLLSDNDEENLDDDANDKKDQTFATVVQTPLNKENSEEIIEDLIDSDLLDEDSLLDSDEEVDSTEQIQPVVGETESTKKVNKYAPTIEKTQPTNVTSSVAHTGIKPTIIATSKSPVNPILNGIKPQIIAPRNTTNDIEKPPVISKYKTEKHKTDAYDFPVDLVSNLKPPAKAKAIKTAHAPKVGAALNEAPNNVPKVHQVVAPSIPVNPYATQNLHKPATKMNPYAPQAMHNPSPSLSVHSTKSGMVQPPVNIVGSTMTNMSSQPHMNTVPPVSKPKGPIPASNTDLPFDIPPPKSVPRNKPQVSESAKNPPINNNRARAVSNVSASSLSTGVYSPNLQNNIPVFDGANGSFSSNAFSNQRFPSRSGSINKPTTVIDNKPKNLYAPSVQHIRKGSSSSFSPVNNVLGMPNSGIAQSGATNMPALQTVGLNNSNNPLSPITPGSKVSHARSHSSVYAPKKNQGAASKYAPTVHPSVQQAFSQQPINEVPNAFAAANQIMPNTHSKTGSYMPPVNNGLPPQNNLAAQNFAGQPSFGFQNNKIQHPMMTNVLPVENDFSHPFKTGFQQPFGAVEKPNSQYLGKTLPMGIQDQTRSKNVLPIINPEELSKKQFPIVHWSASGHVVSLKVSQYQNATSIKIQPQESVVFLPKHFLDFPGVLIRNKTKPKSLKPWLDETINFINGDSAYDVDGKLLWNVLSQKIESMDEKPGEITQLSAYASALYDPTELIKFIEVNKSSGFTNNQFQQSNMSASKLDSEGLAQVLTCLRVGEHSEALGIALKSSDFSMSMVIASLMGKEKWTEVVDLYLKREFQGSGPDSEFAVNLLSSIFQVYIGNGKALIEDFESNDGKKVWALNNWNIILASVLSNSNSGTDASSTNSMLVGFLVDLGIFLSKNGKSLASDCCFILADVPLSFNEVIPGSDVVFSEVGAPNSLDGMLLSDLYEFCHKSVLPKFGGFLTLIGSKISHVEVLLLQKQYTNANKILDVCAGMNKELMKTGNAQLKYVYTIDKLRSIIDSKSDSWIGKPTLSGVWGTLDKSFNKLIGGDNIDDTNDEANSGITKSESKLFDTFDGAHSKNQPVGTNGSFDFSQNMISNRPPHLPVNNLASPHPDSVMYSENANIYQNKNMLTKNAINNLKQESISNMPPGPPSLSSVASSEHFNQQVANNLAKLHSHSRNQSVDSLLSFAPSNQRLTANNGKRGSTASNTQVGHRAQDYTNTDTVIKKTLKIQGGDNDVFADSIKQPPAFTSTASNKYSPVKQTEKYDDKEKQAQNEIKNDVTGDHETDMFLNENKETEISVNSPPKNGSIVDKNRVNPPSNFTFPRDETVSSKHSQVPSFINKHNVAHSTHSLPTRKESDFSPHTSMIPPQLTSNNVGRLPLESMDYSTKAASTSNLPISERNDNKAFGSGFVQPPLMHKAHSSLASPIKNEVLQTDEHRFNKELDADFVPPQKPFNNAGNTINQHYAPVTPHQQQLGRGAQGGGWVKTHSRSSSQILAEMTGGNTNSNGYGFNSGIGGSVYTSRNVSIDSNIASSEPVIRQVRSSSVVFTPDSKRKQSEKVIYDDIVEEDEENDNQNSNNEAMLIEKKLAAARQQAEKEKQRKENEDKKKEAENKKKSDKQTQESGWFGWLKANNNPNEKKPIKAKLGQKNQFYYDEKLKRWVNKNASEEEKKAIEEEANTAPPPPPVIKKKSVMPETKPRSGSILGGPTQRTMGVMPPKNPITGESLIPEIEPDRASFNKSNMGSIVVQTVAEENEEDLNTKMNHGSFEPALAQGPGRLSSNASNVNLTSSATGLDDLLSLGTPGPASGGPPSNFGSRIGTPGTSRRSKKANRGYVNVMDHM